MFKLKDTESKTRYKIILTFASGRVQDFNKTYATDMEAYEVAVELVGKQPYPYAVGPDFDVIRALVAVAAESSPKEVEEDAYHPYYLI